jgi:predicted Rossmann fold flavoprotein
VSISRVLVAGGGAAGFFAAIACARANPECDVHIVEHGPTPLTKVRISGGGRCNVTHACFDPHALVAAYPRGARELLGPFHRFQPADTILWFEERGVALKSEPDGRVFPVTDSSSSIVDCLLDEADDAGVWVHTRLSIERVTPRPGGGFRAGLSDGEHFDCEKLLISTGGCRSRAGARIAEDLGHTIAPPVPSLFTFRVCAPWLHELPGVTMESVRLSVPAARLEERGALLITHEGLSGPAVLRLSAWGARALHDASYRFALHVDWLPDLTHDAVMEQLAARRETAAKRLVGSSPLAPIPARLWRALVGAAGIGPDTRWCELSRSSARALADRLSDTELEVTGKSLHKDEFVTCGGVRLKEVDFRTMESRIRPGLYFAGEVLDIDAITGGFNFQAAWTTGWIAGHALAGVPVRTGITETGKTRKRSAHTE